MNCLYSKKYQSGLDRFDQNSSPQKISEMVLKILINSKTIGRLRQLQFRDGILRRILVLYNVLYNSLLNYPDDMVNSQYQIRA